VFEASMPPRFIAEMTRRGQGKGLDKWPSGVPDPVLHMRNEIVIIAGRYLLLRASHHIDGLYRLGSPIYSKASPRLAG
jgi:hypothetical protein